LQLGYVNKNFHDLHAELLERRPEAAWIQKPIFPAALHRVLEGKVMETVYESREKVGIGTRSTDAKEAIAGHDECRKYLGS
jgi:hypothetical protein